MRIELHNPVDVIMREIADPRIPQRSVALTYAFIMRQEPNADYGAINRAIMRRWKGRTALERVKRMAWEYVRNPGPSAADGVNWIAEWAPAGGAR